MSDDPARPRRRALTPLHRFSESLGQTHQLRGFPYHTGEQYRTALNDSARGLGVANWSFTVVDHGYERESDEFWCLGELVATLWVEDPNDPEAVVARTVVKQQFGGQNVKRRTSDGLPLSMADDRKGAATDALKKAATELGFGLALSAKNPQGDLPYRRGEDEPDLRQAPASAQTRPPSRPPAQPSQPASLDEIEAYRDLRDQALDAGFAPPWIEVDPRSWTTPQLAGFRRQVEVYLSKLDLPT